MDQASSTALRCHDCNTDLIKKPGGGKPRYCPPCGVERKRISNRDAARRRKSGAKLEPERYPCSDCDGEIVWEHKGSPPERCKECRAAHQRQYLKDWQRAKGHLQAGTILSVECHSCQACFDWTVVVGRRPWLCATCQRVGRTARRRARIQAWRASQPPIDLSRRCVDCGSIFHKRSKFGGRAHRCRPCQEVFSAQVKACWTETKLAELRDASRQRFERNGRSSPCQGCDTKLICQRVGLVRKWCGKCLPVRRREVAKAWREANPEAAKNLAFRANQARRTRFAAVEREPYKKSDILKRDNWTCKLCHKRINKRFKGRHSLAPTVDHQIPLEHGGADKPQNLVAAHMGCNSAKGSRFLPQGEQLQLC